MHRPDLGADEVIRTAGSKKGKSVRVDRVHKSENFGKVGVGSEQPLLSADAPSQKWHDLRSNRFAVAARGMLFSAKNRFGARFGMSENELPKMIDGGDCVQVTLPLRVAPRKQAVAAKYDSVAARCLLNSFLEHHR